MTQVSLIALTFALWSAYAVPSEREELILEYSQAMGLEALIDASKAATHQITAAQEENVVGDLRKMGYSDDAISQVKVLFQEVMTKVLDSWNASEASRIYAQAIAESMTDEDLRKAISFYKSEEGVRTLAASNTAAARLQAYIQDETTKSLQTAMGVFTESLRTVLEADAQKRLDVQEAQPPSK